jgi:Flp pilus assembly protein TadD
MNRKQRRAAVKLGQTSGNASATLPGETPMAIAEVLGEGIRHHQAGRLSEAEARYRRVLAVQPYHADALHLLGVVAHQVKRHDIVLI